TIGLDDRLDGKAYLAAELTGPAAAPSISWRVEVPELRVAGVAARDVSVDGRWADQQLRLDDVRAGIGTGRLRARLETRPISGDGTSVQLDVRELVLPGSLTGLGSGTGVAEGRIRDGGLDLLRADATWRGLRASLSGRVASDSSLALRGTLSADLQDVSRAVGGSALTGRASVSAELNRRGATEAIEGRAEIADLVAAGRVVGPIAASFHLLASAGPDARWAGTVEMPRVRWDQVTVEGVSASLDVDAIRIAVSRLRARVAAVPVEAAGMWNWSGSGRAHATLGPVALATITGVSPALHLGGTGHASVDASLDRGVTTANGLVELQQVSVAGVSLGAGRSEVHLRGQALEGQLSFPARRLHGKVAGRVEASGTLTSSLEIENLALQPLLRELGSGAAEQVEGRVTTRADLVIPLAQPEGGRGVIHVQPEDLRILGQPWVSPAPILLRWEGPRLIVERFRLEGPAGVLTASGAIVSPDHDGLSLALDNARLPGAMAGLGKGTVRSDVRLAAGGLELTRLDASWPALTASASGRAKDDGTIEFNSRIEADLAGLGPVIGMSGVTGRATLAAEARGSGEAIEVAGAVRAPGITVRGATVSDIELPFRVSRSSVRIERAKARLGTSRIAADASATWKGMGALTADSLARDTEMKVEVRAPATRLEDLAPLLPPALQGRGEFAVTARAAGTPRAWRGTGALTSALVELSAGPLRQLRVTYAADQTRVEVTDLQVDALGVPIRATADWAWAGGGGAKATLGPASLASLVTPPGSVDVKGRGRATIEARMQSAADVSGTARADLDDVAVAGVLLGRGQIDVSARDGSFRVEAAFPEPRLRASANGRIDSGGTLTGETVVPGIDLTALTRRLAVPGGLGGALSVRATARVPLAEPRRGEGVLTIDPVRLNVASETWESHGPIEIRWARGALSLAAFQLAAKDGLVSGAGTLAADGVLDARASLHLPLGLLQALRPEIRESGGVLDLSLRASGRASAPVLSGDGAIHQGSLLLRSRPEVLRDVEAVVSLSSQGIHLREATGSIGGGRVQARGDLALQGWQPAGYRVQIRVQNVAVNPVEGFSSAWDADLELSGLTREAQLQGRARLVRGLYNRDLSIITLATSSSRAVAADTGPRLRLSVRVNLADNLVVRNRIADLRADGVLTVEGTTAQPVVFGSIESRDGRVVFRGHDWTVTSAAVRFSDPRRIDPYLDVVATTRITEYDVTMQVTGPVSNVAVRFSSTPRLSQNDLLSLVAFGVTGADLKDSPATVLLGEAGKMLAQNVFGIDPGSSGLRISTSSSSSANEVHGFPGDERSAVTPSQNAPGGRKERVRIEYQVLTHLYLSAETDRDGDYGADVVLRFRFR
ncbi:MAG TPA: translocation/assembly module TamB domain-containing protein, partial [Candidatus Methylomirabilis sp.]|nr:translocation/assembly module TamB domain-containing protein [Candidatus Methylomirabilis sp.]